MRKLDLQRSFPRMRPSPEDFEDQSGSVKDLGVPRLLEVALLNGRQRTVHHHDSSHVGFDQCGDLVDLALSNESRRPDLANRNDTGADNGEIDGTCQTCSLFALGLRRAKSQAAAFPRTAMGAIAQMRD